MSATAEKTTKARTTKTTTPADNGAATPATGADARAARLAAKGGKGAAATAPKATPRPVTPVTKASQTGTVKKTKVKPEGAPDPAEVRKQEAEAKRIAREAEAEKKAAARAEREAAAAAKKADRDAAKAERDAAKAERQKANARTLDFSLDDHPSVFDVVALDKLNALPEMVGALPSSAFIRDIKRHGVTSPIMLVRRTDDDANLRVAAGRRRIRASVLAGHSEIPARIYTVGDLVDDVVASFTLSDNVNRSDNVAADVQMIKHLRDNRGMTLDKIAKETGIPFSTVKKRARLLDLLPEVEELLYSGKVPHTVITEMSGLSEEDQRALLKVFAENGKITHNDIKALRNAGKAEAADALDFDSLMDTPAGTTSNRPIQDSGDLATDLITFLQGVAEASGIAFELTQTGELLFDRGGQRVKFQAMAGKSPAPAPEDEAEGDTDEGVDPAAFEAN